MGGYNQNFKVPKNPWNKDVWTGVSSSGSGVATAAGLAFATLGTDTGGSIRFPAASCGIVGLKPTWGRVSRHGVFPLAQSLDHVGPLARSTADCAIVLEAIAGRDVNDPTSLPNDVPKYSKELERPINDVVIGWDEEYASEDVHPELASALSNAVDTLGRLGAQIKEVRLPDPKELSSGWLNLAAAEAVAAHAKYYPEHREEYGPYFREFLDLGVKVSGSEYAEAHIQRLECAGALRQVFTEMDILACPTMGGPPITYSEESSYGPIPWQLMEQKLAWLHFTAPYDYSGQPTLSTPCGLTKDNLPLSLQLVGKHLEEHLLCRVGHAFEQEKRFNTTHPQV